MDAYKNFSYSTLASPPTGTDGTSLTVATGQGALFPAAPFNAVIWPADAAPVSTNAEIVRVTAKSSDTFTITRAQEGSSARTHLPNAQIIAGLTAKTLTDIDDYATQDKAPIASVSTSTALDGAVAGGTVLVDATAGAVTITLPTAAAAAARRYNIKKIDASVNAVTIDGDGSETIDGATTATLTAQYETITLQSNATAWWIL